MTPFDTKHSAENRVPQAAPMSNSIALQRANRNSDTFLWASLLSVALSLGLQAAGQKDKANFVAHWAPTLLLFGVYDRIVNAKQD